MSWKTQPNCRAFDDRHPVGPLYQLMTGITLVGSPRSVVTFVTVHNKLHYIFVPIILLQHGYCTFVIILFGPLTRLFINLTMCIRALFPKRLLEQEFWTVPLFTEWVDASSFEVILTRPSKHSIQLGLFPLGLLVLDAFPSFCCMKNFGDGFDGVTFPRLFISWRKLQLSPFTHCPLVSHCLQTPRIQCTRCFVSLDSWPRRFFHIFQFWLQNSYFECPAQFHCGRNNYSY